MTTQTQVPTGNPEFADPALSQGILAGADLIQENQASTGFKWPKLPFLTKINQKFFLDRFAYTCFGTLFLQQLIIASSTIWVALMAEEMAQGANFTLSLILYLVSLVAPYLPEALSVVLCSHWKQMAFTEFIKRFIKTRQHDSLNWNDQINREETISVLNSEGQATLTAMADHIYNCAFYFFSVLLNITAIAILIEPKFAIAYAFSLILIFFVMQLQGGKQALLAQRTQQARLQLGHSLLTVWDNVLLGNGYNFNLWIKKIGTRLQRTNRLNLLCAIFTQWLTLLVSLLIFLPSIGVAIYSLLALEGETGPLTALLISLPRLFLILGYTQLVFSYFAQWNIHKAKLKMIKDILKTPPTQPEILNRRINWTKLYFTPVLPSALRYELSNMRTLSEPLHVALQQLYPCGRYTLRGENGSGKSTLLMLIKKHVKEQAFYLPTRHHLAFVANGIKMSTGEMLKKQLVEIKECVDVKVILLDEWDANLDEANSVELSQLIEDLAKERCVIEVRHRL